MVLVWILAATRLSGQCQPQWITTGDRGAGISGSVLATASWDPDGSGPQSPYLVAAGTFSMAEGVFVANIVAFRGRERLSLGSGLNGPVYALTVFNGDLIAAGGFTSAGGQPIANIARWNGSAWLPVGGGVVGTVSAMTVFGGELIVGGNLTSAGGQGVSYIARWDGTTWRGLGLGVSSTVQCLSTFQNELIAGGLFTTAGGSAAAHIAAWTGSGWHALGDGVGGPPNATVQSLAAFEGSLIVGGNFTTPVASANLARWDGVQWSAMGAPDMTNVYALAVSGGALYCGGSRSDSMVNRVRRWNGAAWEEMGLEWVIDNSVFAMTDFGGLLVIGGSFAGSGYFPSPAGIACWDGSWHAFGSGSDGFINAITQFRGELIAAGSFSLMGGQPAGCIARWDGTRWWPLAGGFASAGAGSVSPVVFGLTVHNDRLIAGGVFNYLNGQAIQSVATWDGATWSSMSTGLYYWVNNFTVTSGGELYAVGRIFDTINSNVGRWTGSFWQPIGTEPIGDIGIFAIQEYQNSLHAIGEFYQGVNGFGFGRWDGSHWQPLPTGFTGQMKTLKNLGGTLYLGNSSTVATNRVMRWDGAAWQPVGSLECASGRAVFALESFQGDLIAAGSFNTTGGGTPSRIARFDGLTWQPLGSGLNGQVNALAVIDGQLVVAGSFATAGGLPSRNLARWACQCYPNCDNSAAFPVLTANDFQCFLNNFAAGNGYANCDGSTSIPMLTANDFQCFLNKFAAGCP